MNKIRGCHSLTKEQIEIGRKMATHDELSFSGLIGKLIKDEAKRRGLI
jgi:hypothetical protein